MVYTAMTSLSRSPQRLKLLKAVKRAFIQSRWTVHDILIESYDFRVESGHLTFFIKCLDETKIEYKSNYSILDSLERQSTQLRGSGHRQAIFVLDRNFLSSDLSGLVARGIVALLIENIELVASLSSISDSLPGRLSEQQSYLLENSIEYSMFASQRYHKGGDYTAAIAWGRHAVEHSVGYNGSYFSLFNVLKDAREFDAAAELGEKIMQYRPSDPQVLRSMEDLARRRGNLEEAAEWRARLTEQPTTPGTLKDILAKQRLRNPVVPPLEGVAPVVERPPAVRGAAWICKVLLGIVKRHK